MDKFIIEAGNLKQYTGEEHYVTVPAGVKTIGPQAFKDCRSIYEINLPEGLSSIEDEAFQWCQFAAGPGSGQRGPSGPGRFCGYTFL
jgi:hypothetical protein